MEENYKKEDVNKIKSGNVPNLAFDYSIQLESERVIRTLKKYKWYKENGYKPKFPLIIQQKLESDEEINEANVLEAVSKEFEQIKYEEQLRLIIKEWEAIQNNFFDNLKTLGMPIQNEYYVCVTKYGTGGSYGLPNNIQLNLEQKRSPALTLAHEIIHLTIESLIKEFGIEHWTKERLVDLIMNKFFADDKKVQRDPENTEQISEIFEKEFPNIKKIIEEVSLINIKNK
jgi:hypothetical protein